MAKKSATAVKTKAMAGSNYVILMLMGALLAVGITVLVSKSLVATAIRETKANSAKRAASAQLDKNITAAQALTQQYSSTPKETLTKASASLPTTTDYPNLVAMLENMAKVSGVALTSVAPGDSIVAAVTTTPAANDAQPTPLPVPVKAGVSGSLAAIKAFIAAAETSARPMKLQSLQFTASGPVVTAQIDLTTYYQDEAKIPFTYEEIK